jgi:MFS superfamily sulfate permease-like transporter
MAGVSPSLVLAILLGIFWASAAVFARATGASRTVFVLLASISGAWAGDAIGGRIGGLFDLGRIGDFRPLPATIGAIAGIALVVVVAVLAPAPGDENLEPDPPPDKGRPG